MEDGWQRQGRRWPIAMLAEGKTEKIPMLTRSSHARICVFSAAQILLPTHAELEEALDYLAKVDALVISEACEGFGTDDDALTDVLCNRSKAQCDRLNKAYLTLNSTLLSDQVVDECSGGA